MTVVIDWIAFLQVFAAALAGAVALVALYALGLRMLVRSGRVFVVGLAERTDATAMISETEHRRAAPEVENDARRSPLTAAQQRAALMVAYGCFALCAASVIGGILIIVLGR